MGLFALLLTLVVPLNAVAAVVAPGAFRGGKIFELDSHRNTLLFTLNADLKSASNSGKIFRSQYMDSNGKEAMTEEATFQKLELLKYVIIQEQLGEIYELNVAQGKLHFTVTSKSGIKKRDRDLSKNLVIGPSLVPFIHKNWSEIQKGHTVNAQLAVLERMDTFSFEFVKIRESKIEGAPIVIVRMKPSSTFVSAVVRPSYLTVNLDGSQILEIRGRMLPKIQTGSRWSDFDGEAVFTY